MVKNKNTNGKKLFRVFGKKRGEKIGSFYCFLSTSKKGAAQQARKKYRVRVVDTSSIKKIKYCSYKSKG